MVTFGRAPRRAPAQPDESDIYPAYRGIYRSRPSAARRVLAGALALAALPLIGAPVATAEYKTTTSQALAAHAEWLPYAPPPEAGAAAVCLVDTGVDLNPDTASNVVARIALDGGDPGDTSESKHGTQMAMVMGAPINDWGMVGAWPGVRIVSVRATTSAMATPRYTSYANGIHYCLEQASVHPEIRVVAVPAENVSAPTQEERAAFRDALARAAAMNINVILSAGNSGELPMEMARERPSLVVGGIAADGSICANSARGEGVDAFAPGCGLETASPEGNPMRNASGTSQASVIAASFLGALRGYLPGLTASQAQATLMGSAPNEAGLDLRAAFQRAGVGSVVAAAESMLGRSLTANRRTQRRLPKPRFRIRLVRHGLIVLRFANRPKAAIIVLRVRSRLGSFLRESHRSTLPLRAHGALGVCARFKRANSLTSRAACSEWE